MITCWIYVDLDAIDQAAYDRLAAADPRAFPHPALGVLAVPVDVDLSFEVWESIEGLVREWGIPRRAIRPAEQLDPDRIIVELPGPRLVAAPIRPRPP